MSYSDWRKSLIYNMYNATIREFVTRYQPGWPTVVLLPGGMGSQLDRSMEAYQPDLRQPTDYDTVWIDFGILFCGEARSLLIETNGHDRDSHVIVADGPLRLPPFFKKYSPYDVTEQFFQSKNVNYVVFGYDWRRPLDEGAKFLEYFLTHLKNRVFAKHNENPLPNLTLLAHSQGGLVAKIFLHRVVDIGAWMKQLITVATPFYGTWNHQQRYFIGQKMLNKIYPASEVAEITATLPGPYSLMFLPQPIFHKYDAAMGLKRYPMRDPNGGDGADPYDAANLNRYPKWVNSQHLENAGKICRILAAPLPPAVAQRVYNIRSVADNQTPVELIWQPLSAGFNPDEDDSPVQKGTLGLGDGTVPAWSAYHVSVPDENKKELTGVVEDHTYLMEDPQVLGLVDALINDQPMSEAEAAPAAAKTTAASAEEVMVLCKDIGASKASRNDTRLSDPRMWRGIYRDLTR